MHNCKLTRDALIDLALGEMSPTQTSELLAELNDCATCQAEYATLTNTLHVSRQALSSALPGEEFWPAYHARLQRKLTHQLQNNNSSSSGALPSSLMSRIWLVLRTIATTSVRVPVPAAVAMLLLGGILFLSVRPREQAQVNSSNERPPVETRTVQVPVIQERVVTRVVYVPEKRSGRKAQASSLERPDRNGASNIARAGSEESAKTALSLVGFEPTDQVVLKVIKGSHRDEK